jgi:hypothetical protein
MRQHSDRSTQARRSHRTAPGMTAETMPWLRQRLTRLAWCLRHPHWARDRTQSLDPMGTPPPPPPQSDPAQPQYRYSLEQKFGLSMHTWHHCFDS